MHDSGEKQSGGRGGKKKKASLVDAVEKKKFNKNKWLNGSLARTKEVGTQFAQEMVSPTFSGRGF
jgi:hypothetical protein